MIFELSQGRRAGGEEPGEARTNLILELSQGSPFEPRGGRDAERRARPEARTNRVAGGEEPGEARTNLIFELMVGRAR
jgi:hypothetical protein